MAVSNFGRFGRDTVLDGRWSTSARSGSPLLVCLHGGGYDSGYFDVPGHSLLSLAAEAGFPAVALTRPGHPASESSARRQPSFSEAATIIIEAIEDVWQRFGEGRPGVVLLGHSIGAAVAVHVAAQKRSWPLLGLTVSGVGDVVTSRAKEQFAQFPPDIAIRFPLEATRQMLYGPDWTLHETVLADIAELPVSTPSADMVEMGLRWAADLPGLALSVDVPVHYVLAEFDGFWDVSQERVDSFAGLFPAAPFVDASLWRGTGHCIEHHRLGEAYGRTVLAFAERCAMEPRRPDHQGG
ncbi:alpha/beta hydrolase [Amycolatopsis sp. NPDC051371]|uniref:alpha/beta hydrolase n=1 Tax=Amycolatopsis sp. NPDC051371 TaxID=3155800 RepID=UPI00342F8ED8